MRNAVLSLGIPGDGIGEGREGDSKKKYGGKVGNSEDETDREDGSACGIRRELPLAHNKLLRSSRIPCAFGTAMAHQGGGVAAREERKTWRNRKKRWRAVRKNGATKIYAEELHPEVRHTDRGHGDSPHFSSSVQSGEKKWSGAACIEEKPPSIRAKVGTAASFAR